MAEKTRYTDDELEEFKILIEEKLSKARSQLDFYMKQLSEMADNPDSKVKSLEDGSGTVEFCLNIVCDTPNSVPANSNFFIVHPFPVANEKTSFGALKAMYR